MTTWTPETVKIRFIEAAGTERFLSGLRKPEARGYWPEFFYDAEDRAGWDQQARDDQMEIWQGRGTAKADALSRYQECLSWTVERITDPKRRKLVWAFAFCRAYKRDFGETCKKRGWVKSTAYNRLNRVWQELSWHFNNERLLLREPAQYWIGQESQPDVEVVQPGQRHVSATGRTIHQPFRTDTHSNTLQTAEAVEAFASFLEEVNERRRRDLVRRLRRNEARANVA
jgi:hypothetical protein